MIKNWTTVIMLPRFLRLAKFLGSRSAAAGVLVLLQEHGTEVDCRMVFESIADVEVAADWGGKEGELCDELVSLGFLVDGRDGTWVISMPWQDNDQ